MRTLLQFKRKQISHDSIQHAIDALKKKARFQYYLLSPGFDPQEVKQQRQQEIKTQHLTNLSLYLDRNDGMSYLELLERSSWLREINPFAIHSIVSTAVASLKTKHFSQNHVTFISLGSGDGKKECLLLQQLSLKLNSQIKAYLLDINSDLLQLAYQNIKKEQPQNTRINLFSIQANFENLSHLPTLFYSPNEPRPLKIACMLGDTFGQLENEITFMQKNLSYFQSGDLFLTDIAMVNDNEKTVSNALESDVLFINKKELFAWNLWVRSFANRNHLLTHKDDLNYEVYSNNQNIPNSYTFAISLKKQISGRHIRLFQTTRYHLTSLEVVFQSFGWKLISSFPTLSDNSRSYCIFEKI